MNGFFSMNDRKHGVRLAALATAIAAIAATSHPSHSHAQTAQLSDVVVTASRVEQRAQDALSATTLLTRADIERAQTPDLPTLLRRVTGVQIAQNGGPGTLASAFIRGAESRHTLILIDGVPVNNLNFSTGALEHVPLTNVERIEIVRGNVSSLYGSSALGGVIQIFTREAGSAPHASLGAQLSSRGMAQAQASGGVRLDSGTRVTGSVELLDDRGFNAIDQSRRAGTNPDRDGYTRRAVSLGVSQDLDRGRVGLSVRDARGTTRYDSQFGPANQADESDYAVQGLALTGQWRLGSDVTLEGGLTRSADKLRADVTAFPYFVNSLGSGANLGLSWKMKPGQTLTAGVEGTQQRIESDTIYNASSRRASSLRLGYQGEYEHHSVQLNVRQDRYSDFGTANTWFAGYGWRLTPHWRISATESRGFNAPTFNDLYFPFGGNPNLRPERVRSSELALQYVQGAHDLRLTWFSNRFDDLIGNDPFFTRININRASNRGTELAWTGRFGATTARAGLTAQNPLDLGTGARLARRAATLGNLGVSHDAQGWGAGADLRWSGRRPDGANVLGGYAVLDITGSYQLARGTRLFARLDNVADKRYETVFGYNQPRRTAVLGVTWQP